MYLLSNKSATPDTILNHHEVPLGGENTVEMCMHTGKVDARRK